MSNHLRTLGKLAAAAAAVLIMLGLFACSGSYRILSEKQTERMAARNAYGSEQQRTVVEAALSLVGRVSYFWGGKYYSAGECPDWGTPREVTSPGHSTSGTVIPFGLDCSGFVTWCFCQTGVGKESVLETVGDGTWNQWFNSEPIEKSEARLGDVAFSKEYPGSKSNHVGIVVGFIDGEPVIAHCTPSENTVVVSTCGDTFVYFRSFSLFPTD